MPPAKFEPSRFTSGGNCAKIDPYTGLCNPKRPVIMTPQEEMSGQTLRIVDANLNRIGEGLRVLEDIARFFLNDSGLTRQLKTIRHNLLTTDLPFQQQLLQARDSLADVGMSIEAPGGGNERGLSATLVANARRVQEALRVMEEIAWHVGLDPAKFGQARFDVYDLERALLSRLRRRDKIEHLAGLYVIMDTQVLKGRPHVETASQVIRGGAAVIQLRDKVLSRKELLPVARQLKSLCAEHGVLFIVNDYLDVALATDADGLHLGQDDLPVGVARRLLAVDKILGCSARTVSDAVSAESEGADYVAVGSVYPTTSREGAMVVGLERMRQIRRAVSLPLVAIGGINRDNAAGVIAAGASAVAVISAVLQGRDIEAATREMVGRLEANDE
jgi:thiamine-phosphate pyrophosphorylase